MLGRTPGRLQFYQLLECRERSRIFHEEAITKAIASWFRDKVEKAVHPFYGTRRVFGRRV